MSRKHSSHPVTILDEEEEEEQNVVRCTECGSTDVYSEVVSKHEWRGNREVDGSYTQFTCMNLECGHTWRG